MSDEHVGVSMSGSGVRVWLPAGASRCRACFVDPAPVVLTHEQAKDLAVLLLELVGHGGS